MPKIVNHEERRNAIAAAASRAIAEVGIDRVKMTDLAAAAGCTVGALPHYYGGKDDIMIAALVHVHQRVRERAAKVAVKTRMDVLDVWMSILPTSEGQREEWRVWLAFSGRAAFSKVIAEEFRRRYAQGHEDTMLLLRALQGTGQLPQDIAIDLAAEGVVALMDGLGLRATVEPELWPPARQRSHIERHLRLLGWRPRSELARGPRDTG